MSTLGNSQPYQPVYLINFEKYLRPRKPGKAERLQYFETPVAPKRRFSVLTKTVKRLKVLRWARNKRSRIAKSFHQLPLPSFLGFLRARNDDDGLCKPKTGFEIYCELSSIHGFHVFVGAKTWQRVLWWLFICTALLLSLLVLVISNGISAKTPTLQYIDSIVQPMYAKANPFPTVTICSFNRVSKQRLSIMAKELNVPEHALQQLPWITRRLDSINDTLINSLSQTNLTWEELLEQLSPQVCETQLLGCRWQGISQECSELLTTYWSYSEGRCCRFSQQPTCSRTQCALSNKLTLHLATQVEDYSSAIVATFGYEVLIQDAHTVANDDTTRVVVPGDREAHVMLRSFSTKAMTNLASLSVQKRQCYLPHERVLFHFSTYTLENCVAECHSQEIFQSCECVPPFMPRRMNWPSCRLEQYICLREHRYNWQNLQIKCNCLPACQFNRYEHYTDLAVLDDEYNMSSFEEELLYNNKSDTDSGQIVLNIYFGSLRGERLRLGVFQDWLAFIGTFGGITGLFMGCSVVSVFELIFFMCVRPTCNWLTRQQILLRQRRQRRRQVQANNGN